MSDAIKPKFTPGRWSRNIKPATKYNTIFAGRNTHVCYLATSGLSPEEVEANCDLIKAGPDMYEACKLAEANLSALYSGDHIVMQSLRAAIAKADGRA